MGLKCLRPDGLRSNGSLVVVIKISSDDPVSFFVPRERVAGKGGHEGQVKVRAFSEDSRAWAIVPDESQTILAVDESEFVAA